MQRLCVTYDELDYASGVLRSTFKAWRTSNMPGLATMEAALGALGWDFIPTPRNEHLPPELVAELDALGARWADRLEHLRPALIRAASRSNDPASWGTPTRYRGRRYE